MKNIVVLAFIMLALMSCHHDSTPRYELIGQLKGDSVKMVFLKKQVNRQQIVVDSAMVKHGNFKMVGQLEAPELMFLESDRQQTPLAIFMENSSITITGFADSLSMAEVSGSANHNCFADYLKGKDAYEAQMEQLYSQFKSTSDPVQQSLIEQQYDSVEAVKNVYARDYVLKNGKYVVAAYIIRRELIYTADLTELNTLTAVLDSSIYSSVYAQEVFEKIEIMANLEPGMVAPAFQQSSPDGKVLGPADFKGQYLLIDFWASWCGPCRRANPTLVSLYAKYHAKGFEILGVSLDRDSLEWVTAIANDKLTWPQVSDLQFWNNAAVKPYGVNSIPHGILLAPDGTIVKRNIHAGELEGLLQELLKK